jgi:hypothetical protein
MSILNKDYEKAAKLNSKYFKKNLNAELLHIYHVNNDQEDIDFELEVNLKKQYEKNLNFLKKMDNSHFDFFDAQMNHSFIKSKETFFASKSIVSQIKEEFETIRYDNEYIDTLNFLYDTTLNSTQDFFNSSFLFTNNFLKIFKNAKDSSYELNDDFLKNKFNFLSGVLDTFEIQKFLKSEIFNLLPNENNIENQIVVNPSSRKINFLKRFFNFSLNSSNNSDITYKVIDFFKNNLGFVISQNEKNHVDLKKYFHSTNMISQSLYNILESDRYMSTNSLIFGLIPYSLENKKNLTFSNSNILNFPSFLNDTEHLNLKKLKRKDIFIFENEKEESDQLFEKFSYEKLNSLNKRLSSYEIDLKAKNVNIFNYKEKMSNIHSFINTKNIDLYGLSKVYLQNKYSENMLDATSSSFSFSSNKKNMFEKSIFLKNYATFEEAEIEINNINEDNDLYSNEFERNFEEGIKESGLSILGLISNYINPKNLHILKVKKITTRPLTNFPDFSHLSIAQNKIITGVNKLKSLNPTALNIDIQNTKIRQINRSNIQNQIRSRGAIPRNLNLGLNLNNLSDTRNLLNLNTEEHISFIYESKKELIENIRGLSNFNYFNENSNFSKSIIKNRYLVNDCVKNLKNLIFRNQERTISTSEIEKDETNLILNSPSIDKSKLIEKENNEKIEYSFNEKNLDREEKDFILNSKLILKKNEELFNESIDFNIEEIKNTNNEFFDLNIDLTENQIKEKFINPDYSKAIENITKKHHESLGHFVNNTKFLSTLKEKIKEIFNRNTFESDNLYNFSKRANLTELAMLFWSINSNSKGLNNHQKQIINTSLTNILSFYLLSNSNLPNLENSIRSEMNKIYTIFSNEDAIELLTDISPFYMFSNDLNSQTSTYEDYENYNPYKKNEEDEFYEQNGLFYHFLFSNISQEKYFKYEDKQALEQKDYSRIKEYKNNFNVNKSQISPFYICESNIDGIKDFFIKNIFNLDSFKPFMKVMEYQNKKSFMISTVSLDETEFSNTFNSIKNFMQTGKTINFDETIPELANTGLKERYTKRKFENYKEILENIDNIVLKENILNIASIENSIFDQNFKDNDLFLMFDEIFNQNILNKIDVRNSLSFENFTLSNDSNIKTFKNIISSILQISSDIFCRMFYEVQSNIALCNRTFDSNFIFKYSKNDANSVIKNIAEDNFQNLTFFTKFHNKSNEILKRIIFPFERVIDQLYIDTEKFNNFISNQKISNNASFKPSVQKILYYFKEILGMSEQEIKKVYFYIKSNRQFMSKFSNIFDYFNLENFNSNRLFYFENKDSRIRDSGIEGNPLVYINQSCISFFDNQFEQSLYSVDDDQFKIFNINEKNEVTISEKCVFFSKNSLQSYDNLLFSSFYKNFLVYCNDLTRQKLINGISYKNILNVKDIFVSIVSKSYEISEEYENNENSNINEIISSNSFVDQNSSGCKTINENSHYANFNINCFYLLKDQLSDFSKLNSLLNFENHIFSDVNFNWFNQIAYGLMLNDISEALNLEIFKYHNSYEKGLGEDTWKIYSKLKQLRIQKNINSQKNKIISNTGFENFLLLDKNTHLKDLYVKSLLKFKTIKNIKDYYELKNKDIPLTISKFEKELIQGSFIDKYLKENFNKQTIENSNVTIDENSNLYVKNQSLKIKDSTILSVGIENNNMFSLNDIIVIEVDMFDNDFPHIMWETKRFEFDLKINNPLDDIFSIESQLSGYPMVTSLNVINDLKFPLLKYGKLSNSSNFVYNKLIAKSDFTDPDSQKNLTNNIFENENISLHQNYNVGLMTNHTEYISERKNELLSVYENKLNAINASLAQKTELIEDLVKRCVYNQAMSYKLQKNLKVLSGFEPKNNFSIKKQEEKFLQETVILKEVYDLFTQKITRLQNINSETNYMGFNLQDLQNAFTQSDVNYKGLNFKIADVVTNNFVNVFTKFMSDFTKSLLLSHEDFATSNFYRIYNISLKPEDFIATSLNYDNIGYPIVSNAAGITFEPFINNQSVNNRLRDEINTNYQKNLYNFIYSENENDLTFYNIKINGKKYIPKNVSYRVKVSLLDN